MAFTTHDAEAHREFLHNKQDRDQHQLQQQQPITPLRAALGRGNDAAGVGVGQHDHEAWADDHRKACPPRTQPREAGEFDGSLHVTNQHSIRLSCSRLSPFQQNPRSRRTCSIHRALHPRRDHEAAACPHREHFRRIGTAHDRTPHSGKRPAISH